MPYVKYCLDSSETCLQALNYLRKKETKPNYEILYIHLRWVGRSIYLLSFSSSLDDEKSRFEQISITFDINISSNPPLYYILI